MDFKHHILLGAASEKARKEFDSTTKRLSATHKSFTSRMDGNSTPGLIMTIIGSLLWIAAFIAGGLIIKEHAYVGDFGWFLVNATIVAGILLFVVFAVDASINLTYYGKISSCVGKVSHMLRRVDSGLTSIGKNHEAFMKSKDKGWEYRLTPGESIPEEVQSLEQRMASMESLSQNFLNSAKTVIFYILAVLFSVTSSIMLFNTAIRIADNLDSDYMNSTIMMVINFVSLAAVVVGMILLAKFVWSNNCKVTFGCPFIILLAPIAFAILDAVLALVVVLVVILVPILIGIAAVAFVCSCSSNG
ncbi:MAG: hypothetical protein E7563_01755 [Ruminococcaceae bacterium]|nr:hypothetical protein [Oscillospiraceae bacterium]